jgi:hypothetical protein
MKAIKFLGLSLLIYLFMIVSIPFQSCEPDDDEKECDTCNTDCDTCIVVYKPNIYIYPNAQIDLSVKLNFPMGGNIIKSIPEYGTVDTSGLINNTYSYLFYESTQPDVWQSNNGWIIQTDKLESFFRQNMTDYGFNDREINGFIEYWVPRLNDSAFYAIYPQTKSKIDKVIQLEFSKQPENILRLFYVIKGLNQLQDKLSAPTTDSFTREGYFVTEWGVILK